MTLRHRIIFYKALLCVAMLLRLMPIRDRGMLALMDEENRHLNLNAKSDKTILYWKKSMQ